MTHPNDLSGDFDPLNAPRKFTGIWIPREIYLRRDINALEKMLWSELYSLDSEEHGGCYASEKYLCEFLGVQRRQFYEMLKHLKEVGLLIDVAFTGRVKIRKAIMPQEVRNEVPPQQCGKPHGCSAENRTRHIIYKNKEDNKDIRTAQQCANAGTTAKNPDEKIFISSDLDGNDQKKGTLKMPQAKWDNYVAEYGETRVNRCATELSNYLVSHPCKYKSHYLALLTFIKNSLEKDAKAPSQKAKKDEGYHFTRPSGIGEKSFRPKSIAERVAEQEEKERLEAMKK